MGPNNQGKIKAAFLFLPMDGGEVGSKGTGLVSLKR